MKFKRNILLKNFTTLRVGGPADYFLEAKTEEEIIKAIKWAKENKVPFFALGAGSNLLVSDKGFKGLIIKIQTANCKLENTKIIVEAGVSLGQLVKVSAENGLAGLEWAAGIPGTLGGAIFGNAGAFGGGIAEIVKSVKVYNYDSGEIRVFKNKDCQFSYRESIFKNRKNLVILSAALIFKKEIKEKIKQKMKYCLGYRKERQPAGFSAGSVFKNIKLKSISKKFFKKFPEAKTVVKENNLPAAYLISHANLAGTKEGGAVISPKHPNFILNVKNAKAKDVIKLIKIIKKTVKKKFNLELEEETQCLGLSTVDKIS